MRSSTDEAAGVPGDRPTVTAANKATAIEVHTRAVPGNHAHALAALVAADFRNHDPAPGSSGGLEGLVATMHWFSDAFSDQRVEVLHAVTEGDLVALHVHSRRVPGEEGRAIVDIFRVEDGKVVEHWDVIQPIPKEIYPPINDNGYF